MSRDRVTLHRAYPNLPFGFLVRFNDAFDEEIARGTSDSYEGTEHSAVSQALRAGGAAHVETGRPVVAITFLRDTETERWTWG